MFLTLTLTSNGWMSRALSDTRTIIRMRANICQTRSFRVQGQTRSAESCQPLEQVRFGSGVYPQSCPVMSQNARVCPVQCSQWSQWTQTNQGREKKYRKCNFDVVKAVNESEYSHVQRPVDPETKKPLEPAHRFEVNLEGDSVSQAKYARHLNA